MMEHNFGMDESRAQRGPGFRENDGFNPGPQERYEQDFCDREYGGFSGRECHGFGERDHGGFSGRDPRSIIGRDPRSFIGLAGFSGGRERLFDAGDVKLVVLKLLSEQPSYGYQLIKTMEQRLAGGYAPSPGVIYPTLTMLEEEGLAIVSLEGTKKVYSVTPEGVQYLQTNEKRVTELFERLEEAGRSFQRGRSPEIMKAFKNLHGAMVARMSRGSATPEQISKIAEAINAAAKAIDEL
ncbi:MAG: PadR family transcriptional regulator [Methanoregula sp.]